jgi:hypothetical protein
MQCLAIKRRFLRGKYICIIAITVAIAIRGIVVTNGIDERIAIVLNWILMH